jgi:hypothetical protein
MLHGNEHKRGLGATASRFFRGVYPSWDIGINYIPGKRRSEPMHRGSPHTL